MTYPRLRIFRTTLAAVILFGGCASDDEAPGGAPDGAAGTSGSGSGARDAGGGSAGTAAAGGSSAGGSGGNGGSAGSAAGSGTSGTAGAAGTGASGGSDGGASQEPPECVKTCSAAADCAREGANPPFDANNWACESGSCRWLGCLDDSECAFFNGVCRLRFLSPINVKTCTEGCTDVAECVETLVSVDLDNWACVEGGCKYTGCKTDEECAADHGAGAKCLPGDPYPGCHRPCTAPADCVTEGALPHQDADNWVCRDNLCVYAGCTSDQECTESDRLPSVCMRR